MVDTGTIFALSTGAGRAGVAVIRISGPQAFSAAARMAAPLPPPRQAALRAIRHPGLPDDLLDHGLVLTFPGPKSFTGEDCVEFQLHGSPAVIRAVLRALGSLPGLRQAEPGEFTQRAWLNGQLDLLDVERLGDLLAAETETQRRIAVNHAGRFRASVERWREQLLELRLFVEAEIDFADEGDVTDRLDSQTERRVRSLVSDLDQALAGAAVGERLRRGFRVAVLGPPNAGKSTLINALVGREVAITSPVPGTTRDAIEVLLDIDGVAIVITDTAGLRETSDQIEQEGIRRAERAAETADIVLWLSPVDDRQVAPDHRFVTVMTKVDRASGPHKPDGLGVSAYSQESVNALALFLRQQALQGFDDQSDAVLLTHERQASKVAVAKSHLLCAIEQGYPLDLRAEELRLASTALDELVGRIGTEEVLGAIFSRFCIGK